MQHDRDPEPPGAAGASDAPAARLAGVAERLRAAAGPALHEALRDRAFLRTLGALSPDAPLWDLARAAADSALRRTLRDRRLVEELRGGGAGRLSPVGWQFVCNLALAALTEDAVRELRILRTRRREAADWDG
jgi:hypothetical protein